MKLLGRLLPPPGVCESCCVAVRGFIVIQSARRWEPAAATFTGRLSPPPAAAERTFKQAPHVCSLCGLLLYAGSRVARFCMSGMFYCFCVNLYLCVCVTESRGPQQEDRCFGTCAASSRCISVQFTCFLVQHVCTCVMSLGICVSGPRMFLLIDGYSGERERG